MDASLHASNRRITTGADLLRVGTCAVVRLEFTGDPDRHLNPVGDKVTIFASDRAEGLRIAQALRKAADELEAVYAPTMETATMQERRESVARVYEEVSTPFRCTRCGVSYRRIDVDPNTDGNPRCDECAAAVEQEAAAADAAEGHPCHREDA